mgnify:CR=1 FL=1
MNFKLKPLSVAMLATVTALAGCSTEEDNIEKTVFTESGQVNPTTGIIETATSGMVCQLPDIVQTIDSDFYPLTQAEKDALRAAVDPDETWSDEQVADWNDPMSYAAYDYDYAGVDLYAVLGLTNEESARQAAAMVEAKEFKVGQKQDAIFGDGFDDWFDEWFAAVPETDYLGASQRIDRARRGLELSLSSANNNQEVCYTPPTECPNYKILDESGTYDCITPEENPIADAPAPAYTAMDGEAVIYFKKADGDYSGITIHTWNNSNCTAYNEETSATSWGQGKTHAGDDENYGRYWVLDLVDGHDNCGNMIIYNKDSGTKFITQNDAMIPLGASGDIVFQDADKMSFFEEGFPANFISGVYLANQHPFFGASAGSKSCGWGTSLDESGEACIGQAISNCPTGTYAVGVGTVDLASKCVAEFNPEDVTLYLRGGFNGWGNPTDGQDFEYTGDGMYRKNFSYGTHGDDVTASEDGSVSYFFKVADADWSEPSTYGGIKDGDTPAVGATIAMTAGEGIGQDMSLAMSENTIYQFLVDASDVKAATLKVNEVPLEAFPGLSIDGEHYADFEYSSDGEYVLSKVALTAGTYTLSIDDESAGFAIGGATDATTLMVDEALAMVDGGDALTFVVDADADHDFFLNYSDASAPTLTVKLNVPYGAEDVYIRGTMTGWGDPAPAEDKLEYNADTRTYSVIYGLEADGNHNFKFASQAWGGALDLGGNQFTFSEDEGAESLSGDGNVVVAPAKSTAYEFSISFAETAVGVLKVQEAPIYIRGGIYGTGDWAADETMRLNFEPSDADNTTEAGHVYSSVVTTTGTGFFKVADLDWGGSFGFNYGASAEQETAGTNAIVLGEALQLTGGGDSKNISFPHPAGTYRFSSDDVTKQITVTAVE